MEHTRKSSGNTQGKVALKGNETHKERQWSTQGKAVEHTRKGSGTHEERRH